MGRDTPSGPGAAPALESGARQARALVGELAARCRADAVVLLAREGDNWRVAAVAGPGVRRLHPGELFSTAQNPSLSPALGAGRPPLPSEAEPFLAALGPVALGDWITCPVVANREVVGLLHLLTSWSRPFSTDEVDVAVRGAEAVAGLLAASGTGTGAGAAEPWAESWNPWEELAQAVSLLNHDLRSPLNAVLGFADMLAEGTAAPEQVVRYAGIIAKGGEAMQEMVDRIVTHMRILLGVQPWRPERAPLAAFLAGFPAEGDLDCTVHWDTAAIADACRALLHAVTTLGGEEVVVARAREGLVHLTFGAAAGDAGPLPARSGGVPTQFARVVFAAHGGTVHMAGGGAGFGVTLPAEPVRFAAPADPD
jgi:signal transduction histidine kinase